MNWKMLPTTQTTTGLQTEIDRLERKSSLKILLLRKTIQTSHKSREIRGSCLIEEQIRSTTETLLKNQSMTVMIRIILNHSKLLSLLEFQVFFVYLDKPTQPDVRRSQEAADLSEFRDGHKSNKPKASNSIKNKPTIRDEYKIDDYDDQEVVEDRKRRPSPKAQKISQQPNPLKTTQTFPNGYHKIVFENGIYEGYMQDNKRHGRGKYTWNDGNLYEGDWHDDMKHGKGRFEWENGDIYEGEYIEDRREGTGIKYYQNADTYEVQIILRPGRLD